MIYTYRQRSLERYRSGLFYFVVLLRTDRGGSQQRIGNISRPAAAADPASTAVVSTQDTRLSEDAGSVRYGCVHVENLLSISAKEKAHLQF